MAKLPPTTQVKFFLQSVGGFCISNTKWSVPQEEIRLLWDSSKTEERDLGFAAAVVAAFAEESRREFFSNRINVPQSGLAEEVRAWDPHQFAAAFNAALQLCHWFALAYCSDVGALMASAIGIYSRRSLVYKGQSVERSGFPLTGFSLYTSPSNRNSTPIAVVSGIGCELIVLGEFTLEGTTVWWNRLGVDVADATRRLLSR